MKRNRIFHPVDLVFPIGLGALGLTLGVWSLFSDAAPVGKFIAMLTGVFFAAMNAVVYGWRLSARKADYVYRGVRVRLGTRNRPTKVVVQAWIDWVINWWASSTLYNEPAIEKALADLLLVFIDEYKLGGPGRWMRAYYQGSAAVIGYKPGDGALAYAVALEAHELGHGVLDGLGVPWGDEVHHKLMSVVGYDAGISAAVAHNPIRASQDSGVPDKKKLDAALATFKRDDG